eukprot:tig00020961_g16646.t1
MQELEDVAELQALLSQAKRPRVRALLQRELEALQSSSYAPTGTAAAAAPAATPAPAGAQPTPAPPVRQVLYTPISSYAFDQSDTHVKIYISLDGVGDLPKEQIEAKFTKDSLDLVVSGLKGKNHRLYVPKLDKEIVAEESSFRVSASSHRVTLSLRKAGKWDHWSSVAEDPRFKVPKGADKDPGASITEMMKTMYEEGDDNLKKTIAQAWTDSRSGKPPSMGGLGGMDF